MFGKNKEPKSSWRDGVYLCTVQGGFKADLIESKLRSEGIPSERLDSGAGNFLDITMGTNLIYPIDIYVPKEALEDAKNIIVEIPLTEEEFEEIENMDEVEEEL